MLLLIVFELLGCNGEKDFATLLHDLQNTNDSIRFKAIEKLEKSTLTNKQSFLLLKEASKNFPPAKYEWQSIPGIIVHTVTENQQIEFISIIENNYRNYDVHAKNESLRFLSNYNTPEAILLFKNLALKYISDISYLPTGILEKNFSYKHEIFPDLLQLVEHETAGPDVLLLFLNYLNASELKSKDFSNYIERFVSLSKKNRQIIIEKQSQKIDIWNDDEYQQARFTSGVLADLLGYFNEQSVLKELKNYLELSDNKLIMFASISLLKNNIKIEASLLNKIAADSECRNAFYDNLKTLEKEILFPTEYRNQEAFAEGDMINWLLYPTELARMPDSIQLMQVVDVDSKSEDGIVEFYLFRFKSNHETWKDNGWMAGVSGYFPKKEKPLTSGYGYTFSSFEKWESKTPEEHVQEIRELIEEASEK